MTKQALIIQRHPVETLGDNFAAALGEAGFALTTLPLYVAARWEFLLTINPLRVVGGTGSPVNPVAIL